MDKYTNPIEAKDAPNYLPRTIPNDGGRAFME
jgi:hypothetical protein